jgi:outer membrane protein W
MLYTVFYDTSNKLQVKDYSSLHLDSRNKSGIVMQIGLDSQQWDDQSLDNCMFLGKALVS